MLSVIPILNVWKKLSVDVIKDDKCKFLVVRPSRVLWLINAVRAIQFSFCIFTHRIENRFSDVLSHRSTRPTSKRNQPRTGCKARSRRAESERRKCCVRSSCWRLVHSKGLAEACCNNACLRDNLSVSCFGFKIKLWEEGLKKPQPCSSLFASLRRRQTRRLDRGSTRTFVQWETLLPPVETRSCWYTGKGNKLPWKIELCQRQILKSSLFCEKLLRSHLTPLLVERWFDPRVNVGGTDSDIQPHTRDRIRARKTETRLLCVNNTETRPLRPLKSAHNLCMNTGQIQVWCRAQDGTVPNNCTRFCFLQRRLQRQVQLQCGCQCNSFIHFLLLFSVCHVSFECSKVNKK